LQGVKADPIAFVIENVRKKPSPGAVRFFSARFAAALRTRSSAASMLGSAFKYTMLPTVPARSPGLN